MFALQFTEVASALANFSTPEPYLNLTFRLDHRGHIAAVNAAIVSDIVPAIPAGDEEETGGVAGALKGLFGKKDKNGSGESEVSVDGDEADVDGDEKEKDGKKGKKEKRDKEKKDKSKEPKREKVAVKFRETYPGQKPMGGEEKRSTAAR